MKSLKKKTDVERLVQRLAGLHAVTQPLWGSMTATEMLHHCNRIHEQLLTAPPLKKGTSPKQYLSRWAFFYLIPRFPKNVRTPKRNDTKGQIDAAAFESEKQKFIALLHRFASHDAPIKLPHPYFGDLNTKQWGMFGYKHVDHHLRQFGL